LGTEKESTSTGRPHAPEGNPTVREEAEIGDGDVVHLDRKATPSDVKGWEEWEGGDGRAGQNFGITTTVGIKARGTAYI
jgi:hypothetical protein